MSAKFLVGTAMLCFFALPATYAQHSAAGDHPVEKRNVDKTPNAVGPFYCRNGIREVITSDHNLERTDTWSGVVAATHICGGCYFANAPGGSPDPANPVTVSVDWADGTTDSADFTSNHPTVGALTYDSKGVSASHTYNNVINPPKQATFKISALCEDDQGQWREVIDNHCNYPVAFGCTPHSAAIGVYAPVLPSVASIARPVIHGQKAVGALAIVLQDDSPPSGTTLTLTSDNKNVLFPQFGGGPSAQTTNVLFAPNQHAQNYDIDATKAAAGTKFTITVKSTKGGGSPVVTLPYTVQ